MRCLHCLLTRTNDDTLTHQYAATHRAAPLRAEQPGQHFSDKYIGIRKVPFCNSVISENDMVKNWMHMHR